MLRKICRKDPQMRRPALPHDVSTASCESAPARRCSLRKRKSRASVHSVVSEVRCGKQRPTSPIYTSLFLIKQRPLTVLVSSMYIKCCSYTMAAPFPSPTTSPRDPSSNPSTKACRLPLAHEDPASLDPVTCAFRTRKAEGRQSSGGSEPQRGRVRIPESSSPAWP